MKKTILYTLLILFGVSQAFANEYEYVPFVREGVKWVYRIINNGHSSHYPFEVAYYTLQFKGDTVINGKTYKAMHKFYGQTIDWENDTIPVYMREENKVVYGIVPDGKLNWDCLILLWTSEDFYNLRVSGEEFILYDFNDPVTFLNSCIDESNYGFGFEYINIDTIAIGNNLARRHKLDYFDDFYVVEGIGYDGMTSYTLALEFISLYDSFFQLSHVVEDGKVIYKGKGYESDVFVGIDEVVADQPQRPLDPHYYNLMGQPVGTDVPTAPGIYIHQGKKIIVR